MKPDVFEKGKYLGFSSEEIMDDLRRAGYSPVLISENPGDFLESHKHKENHILVVVYGEMRLVTDGKEYLMKPGDEVLIKSQVNHAAYFGKKGCKYFWTDF